MIRSTLFILAIMVCGCANPYGAYRHYPVDSAGQPPVIETPRYAPRFATINDFPLLPDARIMVKQVPAKGEDVVISLATRKSLPEIESFYVSALEKLGCTDDTNVHELNERNLHMQYRCVAGFSNDTIVNGMDVAYSGPNDERWVQLNFKISHKAPKNVPKQAKSTKPRAEQKPGCSAESPCEAPVY